MVGACLSRLARRNGNRKPVPAVLDRAHADRSLLGHADTVGIGGAFCKLGQRSRKKGAGVSLERGSNLATTPKRRILK